MDWTDSDYYITFDTSFTQERALETLKQLANDGPLRGRIQEGDRQQIRDVFKGLGIDLGNAVVPETTNVVLPGRGELRKVVEEIENERELEFTFLPFGVYYPGRRPWPGLLLLVAKAASGR
jgi:hypothetical protein